MSYILDALRRADAERERGAVPGIHAQPVPLTSPEAGASARAFALALDRRGIRAGAAAAPGLAMGRARDAPIAKAPEAGPRRRRRGRLPPPRQRPRTGPTRRRSGSRAASPLSRAHAYRAAAPAKPRPRPQTARRHPSRAPDRRARASPAGQGGRTRRSEERRVLPYGELPDEVRRKLPKLVFGGSIHSDQASDRILIVNGQLLREGETAAPGVVLEQIKRQSAVFKSGDYRYEMSY